MPGVTSSATSDTLYIGNSLPGGTTNTLTFSFNGARTSSNYWTIDGADNVDRGSNLTLLNYPSVDAIEEFKVQRSQYGAEFGGAGAAQILVVTKSGTSSFHGGAYEFVRNDDLQANNFFNNLSDTARPPLRWNDFGYTFCRSTSSTICRGTKTRSGSRCARGADRAETQLLGARLYPYE
jgi:hypothetical protein